MRRENRDWDIPSYRIRGLGERRVAVANIKQLQFYMVLQNHSLDSTSPFKAKTRASHSLSILILHHFGALSVS